MSLVFARERFTAGRCDADDDLRLRSRAAGGARSPLRMLGSCLAAAIATTCLAPGAAAQTASPIALKSMKVEGAFLGEESGRLATDISGIACLPADGARRTCLLVNDENRNAQFATLEGDRLIVGQPIALIGDAPDPKTLGAKPNVACPKGAGDFGEFDGEGVSYSEPYFYVVGSHGCSRKKDKFALSSFMLARVRVDRQGRPADGDGNALPADKTAAAVQTTYRVSDLLARGGAAAQFIGKALKTANGLNIEGIAVDGDDVWLGLRGPVLADSGKAILLRASVADLFGPGGSPSQATPKVIELVLDKLGIRDLALLPDKRLLVLAGPAQEQDAAFQLFGVDTGNGKAVPLGQLPKIEQMVGDEKKVGKAEAVFVFHRTADQAELVVLFDELPEGAPHHGLVPPK